MAVTTISSRFCQRERCRPVESLRVMSFEPTASTSISPHVNTIVPLSLRNPYCQKIMLVGAKAHDWPPVPIELALPPAAACSRVTTTRAMTNPSEAQPAAAPNGRRETK